MKRIHSVIMTLAFTLGFTAATQANNMTVVGVSLVGQNPAQDFVLVKFDLAWDNSWRVSVGPQNWDAAWVFIKYRANHGAWQHATINYVDGTATGDGHTAPAGSEILGADDNTGVFIRRATVGSGDNLFKNVHLRWNYGADGLADNDEVEVSAHAIEMVYVPQGEFKLGSGGTENGHWYTYPDSNTTYKVTNTTGPLLVDDVNGQPYNLWAPAFPFTLNADWPYGYEAFYCMKYEISQGQWVDFLNKITATQIQNGFSTVAATYLSSPRVTVSFDGIMELSGNIREAVWRASTESRNISSQEHGNGEIGSNGETDLPLWNRSFIGRGGSFNSPFGHLRVSDFSDFGINQESFAYHGGRGVRRYP